VHLSDSGSRYSVLVTNRFGNALSSEAVLTVLSAVIVTESVSGIAGSRAVFNGSVTPGANQTTVWFDWGTDASYDHRTPGADLGTGFSPLSFSDSITGLAISTIYHYRAVASNVLGTVTGEDASFLSDGLPFDQTTAPVTNWNAVASSADGARLVAVTGGLSSSGPIYTSTDSGATWTPTIAPIANWRAVASSADGTKLAAAVWGGPVYTSTNSGATWTTPGAPNEYWSSIAVSGDGSKLAVAAYYTHLNQTPAPIYTSTNWGATWSLSSAPTQYWTGIASSADGKKLVAANSLGGIYSSTDSGAIWSKTGAPDTTWNAVASSADGTTLVAAELYGSLFISKNSGATWTVSSTPESNSLWSSLSSSADGMRLVAATGGFGNNGPPGSIYNSKDSGTTWRQTSAAVHYWPCVASSADGNKLVAVVADGGIWTSQSTPAPLLSITPSGTNLVLSWTVPSMDFLLQRNSDLTTTNWTEVTNTPTLNLTNLQYQVLVSASIGSQFYRLKH
jgi:hypothetical protein